MGGSKKKKRASGRRAQAKNTNASASASTEPASASASTEPAETAKTNRLIVGIDFGTTFSGVAWAFTSDRTVRVIRDWPAEPNRVEKIKTELVYTEKIRKNGTSYKWGSEVKPPVDNPLRWFKLLLQEDGDRTESADGDRLYRLEDTKRRIPEGKTSVDLVADYLQGLYRHFRKKISSTYPARLIEKLGTDIPVHFYLTVPAIWNSAAKEKTLQAARKAGMEEFGSLHLISEPEAAAAHCFVTFQGTDSALKLPCKPNDVYVIADCGGGTVDMISYEIVSAQPKLEVNEAAVGTGELCGSVFLDDGYERLIKERIGDAAYNSMSDEEKRQMIADFERKIKHPFGEDEYDDDKDDKDDGDDDDEEEEEEEDEDDFYCQVPGVADDESTGVLAQTIVISRDEVKKIFDPILTQITQMVQEQIITAEKNSKRSVTAVILVGGFGRSKYLREHLKHSLIDSRGEKIGSVLQVADAWQAIVQGAVQHGLMCEVHTSTHIDNAPPREVSGFVQNRRVRASYGFSAAEPFDPEIHQAKASQARFNPLYMTVMVPGRMQWFIKKGEQLSTKDPKKNSILRLVPIPASRDDFNMEFEIFMSEANRPPADEEDASVKPFTKFNADYDCVPRQQFHVLPHRLAHMLVYEVETDLIMETIESADVEFRAECQGRIVGKSKKLKTICEE